MTPEEKLFAVIQRGGSGTPIVATHRFSVSPKQWWTRARAFMTHPRLEPAALNRLLYVGIGALVVANGLLPVLWRPSVEQVKAEAIRHAEVVTFDPPLASLKPTDAYTHVFAEHNPFHVQALAQTATGPTTAPGQHYADLLKQDFRLVGISWGAAPVAMVEQVSQQRTFVVKAGEALPPFTVKTILPDRVVLSVESQDFELF